MSLVLLGQNTSAASTSAAPSGNATVARRIVASAAATLLLASVAGTAFAAPGATSNADTTANVQVSGAITLTALTPSFRLTGLPGATVANAAAVSMKVQTNNVTGYSVSVISDDPTLDPAGTNPDSIPIDALSVDGPATNGYEALSDVSTVLVATKGTRSASGGDTIVNGYQVVIPFVNADTYSATLNYVATDL